MNRLKLGNAKQYTLQYLEQTLQKFLRKPEILSNIKIDTYKKAKNALGKLGTKQTIAEYHKKLLHAEYYRTLKEILHDKEILWESELEQMMNAKEEKKQKKTSIRRANRNYIPPERCIETKPKDGMLEKEKFDEIVQDAWKQVLQKQTKETISKFAAYINKAASIMEQILDVKNERDKTEIYELIHDNEILELHKKGTDYKIPQTDEGIQQRLEREYKSYIQDHRRKNKKNK